MTTFGFIMMVVGVAFFSGSAIHLTVLIHNVPCRLRLTLIHTHIQWNIFTICKTTLRIIKLIRRNPKIKKNPIHFGNAQFFKHLTHLCIIASDNRYSIPIRFQPLCCRCNRLSILVNPNQSAFRSQPFCNFRRMSCTT